MSGWDAVECNLKEVVTKSRSEMVTFGHTRKQESLKWECCRLLGALLIQIYEPMESILIQTTTGAFPTGTFTGISLKELNDHV